MNIVYFLQRANGDIKIGFTHDYRFFGRLYELTKIHGTLRLLGYVSGGRQTERELHQKFAPHRRWVEARKVKGRLVKTEFFAPSDEIVNFIKVNSLDVAAIATRSKQGHPALGVGVGDLLVYEVER